jgi:hypothetical protein
MSLAGTLQRLYRRSLVYGRFISRQKAIWRRYGAGPKALPRGGFTGEKRWVYPGFDRPEQRRLYVRDVVDLKTSLFSRGEGAILDRKDVLYDYVSRKLGLPIDYAQIDMGVAEPQALVSALSRDFARPAAFLLVHPRFDGGSYPFVALTGTGLSPPLDTDARLWEAGSEPDGTDGTDAARDRPAVERVVIRSGADGRAAGASPWQPGESEAGPVHIASDRAVWLRLDTLPGFTARCWERPQVLHLGVYRDMRDHRPFIGFANLRRGLADMACWPGWENGFESIRLDPEGGGATDIVLVEGIVAGQAVRRPGSADESAGLPQAEWNRLWSQVRTVMNALPNIHAASWYFLRAGDTFHLVDVSNQLNAAYPQVHGPLLADPRIHDAYAAVADRF